MVQPIMNGPKAMAPLAKAMVAMTITEFSR